MSRFLIKQAEIHSVTYHVIAEDQAEAIAKVLRGEVTSGERVTSELVLIDYRCGLPLDILEVNEIKKIEERVGFPFENGIVNSIVDIKNLDFVELDLEELNRCSVED